MKQLSLLKKEKTEHGGSLTHTKRHTFKPLHSKKIIHLVLKTENRILFKNKKVILEVLKRQEKLSGVKIYKLSVQHNHIHHALVFSDRSQYKRYVRAVTGILARYFGRGVWKYRPYTKVVEWGRQWKSLKAYIEMNELEVHGHIPCQPRISPK